MIRTAIRLDGDEQLLRELAAYGDKATQYVADAVNATGLELRGEIVKAYQRGPKSGRVYQKYNPRRMHQASAPEQAPATDTGRLVSSVDFTREADLSVTIGSSLAYAASLEFGTRRIAPRPAWLPAVEAMRPKFERRLRQALEKAAR